MDTLAHALWSFIIFHKTEYVWLAVFFGAMPDLFSWTIWMLYPFKKDFTWKKPDLGKIPRWVFTLYGITHSIFVFMLTFVITFLVTGSLPAYLFAWIIHILIDIPTHSRDFLPTPFLWPISEWKFPGFSWGTRWFMITNYTALIIALLLVLK